VDARAPYGNGEVLPAGALREPAAGLSRADVIVVTHHDVVDDAVLEVLEQRLRAFKYGSTLVWGLHTPSGVRSVAGGPVSAPESLAGQDVFLFCGIAWPEGFEHTAETLGANVTGMRHFIDHHDFDGADLAKVRSEARTAQLLCTEKDAAKVARIPGNDDVLCLMVDMEIRGEMPPLPTMEDIPVDKPLKHGDFRFPLQY
jgi:tetraacyldisaccharide 4'-kinase